MVILGGGNIGRAVALSDSFPANGFQTLAIFDADPGKIGTTIGSIRSGYRNADGLSQEQPVDIAVLAVPPPQAQEVADDLCRNGITAIWNFVPADLKLPPNTTVVNVHLEEGLEILSFKMKQKET
jgi:redox-sensing transcriptional repressor